MTDLSVGSPSAPLELVQNIGWNGRRTNTVSLNPAIARDVIAHAVGRALVVRDVEDAHDQHVMFAHDADISCIDVSASGRYIVTGQAAHPVRGTGTIVLWDFDTREVICTLQGHGKGVVSVSFSPDERWIASLGGDGKLSVWEIATQSLSGNTRNTDVDNNAPTFVSWAGGMGLDTRRPKYKLVAGFAREVRIYQWEFSNRNVTFELTSTPCQMPSSGGGIQRYYTCGAVGPDNDVCVAGTTSGDLVFFSVSAAAYRVSLPATANGVLSVAFLRHGALLVGGGDGKLKLVVGRDKTWNAQQQLGLVGGVTNITTSGDGESAVVGTNTGILYRVLTADLSCTVVSSSHTAAITDICFPNQGANCFATCSEDGCVKQWDLSEYKETHSFLLASNPNNPQPMALPTCLAYTPDDGSVIVGYSDGAVREVNVMSDRAVSGWQITQAHKAGVTAVCSCSKYFATGGRDGMVRVWSHRARETLLQMSEHSKPVTALVIDNTTDEILHSASMDKSFHTYNVFDSQLGKGGRRLTSHSDLRCTGFLSASQRRGHEHEMAIGTVDGDVHFFDVDMKDPVATISDASRNPAYAIAVSPSGRFLARGMEEGVLALFRLRDDSPAPEPIHRVRGHGMLITKIAWSGDERQIVTVSKDGTICVWNWYDVDD